MMSLSEESVLEEFLVLSSFDDPFDSVLDHLFDLDRIAQENVEFASDVDFAFMDQPYIRLINLINARVSKGLPWKGLTEVEHFYTHDPDSLDCFHLVHYKGLHLVSLCVSDSHISLLTGSDAFDYNNDNCCIFRVWRLKEDVIPRECVSDPGFISFLTCHPNFHLVSFQHPLLPWELADFRFVSQSLPPCSHPTAELPPFNKGVCHPPTFVRISHSEITLRSRYSLHKFKSREDKEFSFIADVLHHTERDDFFYDAILDRFLRDHDVPLVARSYGIPDWLHADNRYGHRDSELFKQAAEYSGPNFFMPNHYYYSDDELPPLEDDVSWFEDVMTNTFVSQSLPIPDLFVTDEDGVDMPELVSSDEESDSSSDDERPKKSHFESQAFPVQVEINDPQFMMANAQLGDFNATLKQLADEGMTHKLDPEQLETFTSILSSVRSTISNLTDTIKTSVSTLASAGAMIKNLALLIALAYAVYKVYTERDSKWGLGLTVISSVCAFNFAPGLMTFVEGAIAAVRGRANNPVSQSLTDISEIVKSLVVGCVSWELVGSTPSAKSTIAFGKRMADLPKTMEGFDTFVSYLHSVLEKAFRYISSTVFGRDVDYFVKTEAPAIDRWCESVISVAELHHKDEFPTTVANYSIVRKLESEYLRLSKEVYSGVEGHRVRMALSNYYNTLKKVLLPFERKNFQKSGYRQEPLCVLVMGAPGVGKSISVWPFIIAMMKECAGEEDLRNFKEEYPNNLYSRQVECEYWEEYNRQWAVIHDDFGQKRDSIGDGTEPFDIIRSINQYPFVTHQADIESKGKKTYDSKLVVCTTNRFSMSFPSINEEMAVIRRMHLSVIQTIKPEFAVDPEAEPEHRILNMDHPHVRENGGSPKLDIIQMVRVKWTNATHYEKCETMTFYEYVALAVKMFKEKEGKAQLLKDFLDDIAENGLKSQALPDDPDRVDASSSAFAPEILEAIRDHSERNDPVPDDDLDVEDILSKIEEDHSEAADTYTIGLLEEDYEAIDGFVHEFFPRYNRKTIVRALYNHTAFRTGLERVFREKDTMVIRNRKFVGEVRTLTINLRNRVGVRIKFQYAIERYIEGDWAAARSRLNEARTTLTDWVRAVPNMITSFFTRLANTEARFNNYLWTNYPQFWQTYNFLKAFLANLVVMVPLWIGLVKLLEWLLVPKAVREAQKWQTKKRLESIAKMRALEEDEKLKDPVKAAQEDAEIVEALKEGLVFDSESTGKDKSNHRARRAVIKGRNREKHPDFYSESGGDVNLAEMMKKVSMNNLYIMYYPESDGGYSTAKAGQITVVSGHAALLPYHYCATFQYRVDNEKWTEDTKVLLKSKALECEVSVKYFLKAYRSKHFENNDLYMFELPKTMPTHGNIMKYFCTNAQQSHWMSAYGGLWLAYDDWTYNPAMHIKVGEAGFTVDSGEAGMTELSDVYLYRCPTKAGDCGGLLTINDRSVGPGKILGVHTAGTNTSASIAIGIASKVTREQVEEVFDMLCKESAQFPLPALVVSQCLAVDPPQILSHGFPLLGTPERAVYGSPMTRLRPSGMAGMWSPVNKAPARLCRFAIEGEVVNPLEKAVQKYRRSLPVPVVDPPLETFRHAARLTMAQAFRVSNYAEDAPKSILTIEEAVYGIPGVPFMDAIPKSTSPGYPYALQSHPNYPGKTWWLGVGDERFGPGWEELVTDVEIILAAARKGERSPVFFTDFLKDELRTHEKVSIGKTRLISGSSLPYLVAFRMMFLPLMAWDRSNCVLNMSAVGMNPYSHQWHILAKLLKSKGPKAFDADFAGLDTSHFHEIFVQYAEFANLFFEDGEENALVRRVLMEHAAYSIHVAGSEVYLWSCVEPSGFPATTDFNGFAVLSLLRACWIDLNPRGIAGAADFDNHVVAIVLGDDHAVNISDYASEFYNQKTLVGAMARYGYVYTDAQKNSDPEPWKTLEECSFLKRGFRFEPHVHRYVCPLDLDTILEMPYWYRKGPNELESQAQTVDIALKELSLHDPELWEEFAPKILSASKNTLAHLSEFNDRGRTQAVVLSEDYVW